MLLWEIVGLEILLWFSPFVGWRQLRTNRPRRQFRRTSFPRRISPSPRLRLLPMGDGIASATASVRLNRTTRRPLAQAVMQASVKLRIRLPLPSRPVT
jgi:hypothetical protein